MGDAIIDANVLQSAGETSATFSVAAREILREILDCGTCIVLDQLLDSEWRRHCSKYSLKWLAQMVSRGQIVNIVCDSRHAGELARVLRRLEMTKQAVAQKDYHLLEVAITLDVVVLSFEVQCRNIYCEMIAHYEPISRIYWVSPLDTSEIVRYLRRGHSPPLSWQLSATSRL